MVCSGSELKASQIVYISCFNKSSLKGQIGSSCMVLNTMEKQGMTEKIWNSVKNFPPFLAETPKLFRVHLFIPWPTIHAREMKRRRTKMLLREVRH